MNLLPATAHRKVADTFIPSAAFFWPQSSGSFLFPGQDPIVSTIEHRIAQLTILPVENQEPMQASGHRRGRGPRC